MEPKPAHPPTVTDELDGDDTSARTLRVRLLRAVASGVPGPGQLGRPAAQTVALNWACERATAVLAARTKGFVRAGLAGDAPRPLARDQAFGVELTNGSLVSLDAAGARALADRLAVSLGGMRGTGELSGTEHGLLEFLALEVADALSAEGPGGEAAPVPALAAVLRGAEVGRRLEGWPGTSVALSLEAGGRAGAGAIWLPATAGTPWLSFPPESRVEGAGTTLTLALPVVHVQEGERDVIAPGDVVLLGMTRLTGVADCELVTTSGWLLSRARILRDSADLLTVAPGALLLGDSVAPAGRTGVVPARVTFGEARLHAADLEAWREGEPLDLRKEAHRPARLHLAGAAARPVELVAVDGEVGARILS